MTRARAALFLVLLVLIAEPPMMYAAKPPAGGPLRLLFDVFFAPSPLKFPFFFYAVLVMLLTGLGKKSSGRGAATMKRAIWISIGSMLAWAVLGLLRGGVFAQIPWQIYQPICFLMFGAVLIDALRTPNDLESLGKVVFAAGVWRSLVAVVYYFFVVRKMTNWAEVPAYMTIHDDTTLFVTTLALVGANVLHRPSRRSIVVAALVVPLVLLAIQVNNRRLAWVTLLFVIAVCYAMMRPSKARRRVNRWLLIVAPLIALYVAVGWGRSERIFKPLKSLATTVDKKDSSSASRDAENDGLVVTFGQGYLTGTGWGHKYVEVDNTFRLDGVFDQWAYVPHNSLLGLVAFMGVLGFMGAWFPMAASVFLNGRAYRAAKTPLEQTAAMVGVAEVVVYANQMYGDMGFGSQTSLVLVVSAFAGAARLVSLGEARARAQVQAQAPTRSTSVGVGASA
jgi:hypothetical protein